MRRFEISRLIAGLIDMAIGLAFLFPPPPVAVWLAQIFQGSQPIARDIFVIGLAGIGNLLAGLWLVLTARKTETV